MVPEKMKFIKLHAPSHGTVITEKSIYQEHMEMAMFPGFFPKTFSQKTAVQSMQSLSEIMLFIPMYIRIAE